MSLLANLRESINEGLGNFPGQQPKKDTYQEVMESILFADMQFSKSRFAGPLHFPTPQRLDARHFDPKALLYGQESGSGSGSSNNDKNRNSYGQQMPNGAIRFSPTVIQQNNRISNNSNMSTEHLMHR